jgi:glycerophosphoryl diester phosphodiesterase
MSKQLIVIFIMLFNLQAPVQARDGQSSEETLILAHRASSGLWIQNSRNAVQQTVALYQQKPRSFHGIEVDIVLSKDLVPVLSHDPWIHTRLCQRNDKARLTKTFIKDLTLANLQRDYICGSTIDNDFPNAKTKPESIMEFTEFLSEVRQTPELIVYLDLKIQPPLTLSAEQYADAIFSLWQQFDMPNPLYIEGPDAQAIAAYRQHATTDFKAVLSFPAFWADKDPIATGVWASIKALFKPKKAITMAKIAEADAIASPTQVANNRLRKSFVGSGKEVIVFTPNTAEAIATICKQKTTILISDYPNLGPC